MQYQQLLGYTSNINILFTKFNKELEAEYQKIVQQSERAKTITVITIISVIFMFVLILLIIGIININKKRKARRTLIERKKKLEEAATRLLKKLNLKFQRLLKIKKHLKNLRKLLIQVWMTLLKYLSIGLINN
ncbi:hypothetical protein [Marinitoga lauensis]|uniref:hypothetical protein n=1 Tax=Marinitoga lauensis TaxID=2201189 RepID=UPI001013585E|nr:hypothetical protein [Marinitoga lauensis]